MDIRNRVVELKNKIIEIIGNPDSTVDQVLEPLSIYYDNDVKVATEKVMKSYEILQNEEIFNIDNIMKMSNDKSVVRKMRDFYTEMISWSIPNENAVNEIVNFTDDVLGIFSGNAFWESLIAKSNANIDVLATDICQNENSFIKIEIINALEAVDKYNNKECLFMSWPPLNKKISGYALDLFKGKKCIIVGEEDGGCTGGENLFSSLENNWELVKVVDIPRWLDVYDSVFFYERK